MDHKKKILIFIDWYLPGFKAGGPIQSISNLVSHLSGDFDFYIVTRDTDYCESIPYKSIKSDDWNDSENGTKVYYFSQNNLNRIGIRNLLRKTDFDVVYLNGIYSFYFTLLPLIYLRKKHNKKVVVAARGMLAASALGVKKNKKSFFIRAVKILSLFDNVIFHATNENEKNDIQNVLGEKYKIKVAANLPPSKAYDTNPNRIKDAGFVRIVNVARVAPEKNLLFALKALMLCRVNVEFDFYGPIYNQEYWNECKEVMNNLPQNVKVIYKGSVESEKVFDVLKEYHFMFMPTQGENFGHIILQSFMAGCPVIISDKTPWKNLEEKNIGWDIPLNDIEKFANIIENTSKMNQDDFNLISKSTFEFAQQYLDNVEIVNQSKSLFH